MPRGINQTNFTSGELDPKLTGRLDISHYYKGAQKLRNVFILPQGGATRRPGLEHKNTLPNKITRVTSGVTITCPNGGTTANANDGDDATLVTTTTNIGTVNPYVVVHYDLGSAKTILFADIRLFYTDAGVVDTNDWAIQYSTDDVAWNNFSSSPLVPHKGAAADARTRRKTGPITARYWRFARVGATDMGTQKAHISEFNLWEESTTVSNVRGLSFEFSTTQSYAMVFTDENLRVFKAGAFQADIPVDHTSDDIPALTYTQALDTLIACHGTWYPLRVQRQGDDDEWQPGDAPLENIPVAAFNPVTTTPAGTLTPSGTSGFVTLTASGTPFSAASVDQFVDGNGGLVRITDFVSTSSVKGVALIPFFDTSAIASGAWFYNTGYEAAWSATRGYPVSADFHEARLIFGGSRDLPSSWWGSRAGDFFNFALGQNLDDDGIAVTLNARDVPAIYHTIAGRDLTFLTSSSEWYVPQAAGQPLTPATVATKRQTGRGSKQGIRPVDVSGALLFIQRQGKALREFLFSDVEQAYTSNNISLLSSHLLVTPVGMALRKSTATDEGDLIPVVNSDGTCALLTTLRDQDITAWSQLSTPGATGLFKDVLVDVDDIYFIVQRTVNGATTNRLEKVNDDLHLDAGVYTTVSTPTGVLAGLDHLEGESVEVVVDGAVQPNATVSSGSITLARNATATIEAGLGYTWQVKPMPIARQLADGTAVKSRKKRVVRTTVELLDTKDILIDGERPGFRAFGGAGAGSPLDTAIAAFTGFKTVEGRLGWSENEAPDITGTLPLPATVLSAEMEVQF